MKKTAAEVKDFDKPAETKLVEQNKDKPEVAATEEVLLEPNRKGPDDGGTYEARLQNKSDKNASPNKNLTGLPEKRLDTAKHGLYPHRNPDAWERTKDKRPVNALREEMGDRSDAAQLERWEKLYSAGPKFKRSVDKDVGKQMQTKAFNMRQKRVASLEKNFGRYLDYRQVLAGTQEEFNLKNSTIMKEAKAIDDQMVVVLTGASGRQLTDEEKKKIAELKEKKTQLLIGSEK